MPRLKVVVPEDEPDHADEVRAEELRLLEAMLFASSEPLDEKALAVRNVHFPPIRTRWTPRVA